MLSAGLVGSSYQGMWETVCLFFFSSSLVYNYYFLPFLFFSYLVPVVMEDLSKQWTKLSLLNREGDKITLEKNRESNEHIIATKFLT